MSTSKLVTYKKTLKDGSVKEYTYERAQLTRDPNVPKKPRTRPVSKRVLNDIIKEFTTENLALLIIYAKELSEKNLPKPLAEITTLPKKSSSESDPDSETDEI
jgi:hypothetical protein